MLQTLQKTINSQYGKILVSILLGLGLASLFRRTCHGEGCLKFVAPLVSDVENKVFQHGNNCHKFKAVTKNCESSKEKRVSFSYLNDYA